MTDYPRSAVQERRRVLLRRIGMGLSALMVITVLVILGLIVRSESAHDEATCPFAHHSERSLGDARVIEESRRCLPEVEERRWLVERAGTPSYELGRKRLDVARFSGERFRWELRHDAEERLVLHLTADGELLSEFREEDAAGR